MTFHGPGLPHKRETLDRMIPLNSGETQVALSLATICGSDLHTHEGRRTGPVPCVLGHEGVGVVSAIGPGGDPNLLGRRVTWTLADSCGTCPACRDWSLPQKCRSLFKYGHAALDEGLGLNGCFASHIVLRPGTTIVPLPDAIPDEAAAPANCALATMVAVIGKIPADVESVLIQGAGLLGIYGTLLLRQRGVQHIHITDPNDDRLSLAAEFGAEPSGPSPEWLPSDSVDAVIEVAGTPGVIPEAIRILRPGGVYVLAGMVHPQSEFSLLGETLIKKCLTIVGVHNYAPGHLVRAVELLADLGRDLPKDRLVSPPLPLNLLEDAFALAKTRRWCRVAVQPECPL